MQCLDRRGQLRRRFKFAISQTGAKARRHLGAVFILNICIGYDVVDLRLRLEYGQARAKQKKVYIPAQVESADLGQDGKGRIVQHDAVFRVFVALIVSARIKRAHQRTALQSVALHGPGLDRLENLRRRIAVVGRLFLLEFLDEIVVCCHRDLFHVFTFFLFRPAGFPAGLRSFPGPGDGRGC